jgi:hypothetical protein
MRFRFKKTALASGVFKIGMQTSGNTNHMIIWADDNELPNSLLQELNYDGGVSSGDIDGAYDNVWFIGEIKFQIPGKRINYKIDEGAVYYIQGLNLSGDLYLYAVVTNSAAAAQTIEIDYFEITAS